MPTPEPSDFEQLFEHTKRRNGVIPVFREVLADLDTPVSAFMRVCRESDSKDDYAFLLESVEGGERWARYSFIGLNPAFVIRANNQTCERVEDGNVVHREERTDPLTFLEEQLGDLAWTGHPDLPRFAGGAVGWLGWDAIRWWERLPSQHTDSGAPPLVWSVPRDLLIFDNLKHCIQVVHLVFVDEHASAEDAYRFGLVNKIASQDNLDSSVWETAKSIASRSSTTMSMGKGGFYRQVDMDLDDAYAHTSDIMARNMAAPDAQEGVDAFMDKRKPEWKGQ